MMTDRQPRYRKVMIVNAAMSSDHSSNLLQGIDFASVNFDDISADLLRREHPDCILAPLMIGKLDILDIAERLCSLGYQGLLLAVTPPIPNPKLIRAEIAALCPGLQFDVIEAPVGQSE